MKKINPAPQNGDPVPMFCPNCDRAVAYVNEEKSMVTFLHVVFGVDGKSFCAHCEGKLDIDLNRKAKEVDL